MRNEQKKSKYLDFGLLLLFFALILAWSLTAGKVGGPDEPMRYNVAKYLYEHPGHLPHGAEESIRSDTWGLSYAFYPILSYMVSAVFMWIAGTFSTDELVLLHAARLADVLFVTVAAWYVIQIGKRLFGEEKGRFYAILVMFLPGFAFMGTYVNTDSLALMAAAMILYAWVKYLDEGWTWKNCILLAVGMAVCFLSYFNAYGWILWSFFFFCITILCYSDRPFRERFQFLMSRGMTIAGVTFSLAGWWFIRNYILYDGDFLGRKASTLCAEIYAEEAFKPSNHLTPSNMGWNLKQFFLYQDPGWPHNWVIMVLVTFVGTFGHLKYYMNETASKVYIIFIGIGVLCMVFALSKFRLSTSKGLFHLMMFLAMITPVILFINYAFCNDNQAQGRYIMSAIYPLMYFVTLGYDKALQRFIKKEEIRRWFFRIVGALWILGAILVYALVIIPSYT